MTATRSINAAPGTTLIPSAVDPRPGEPEAIFVVGVPRSGTTLMRVLLETSERIGIARENHYVGHFVERLGARFYFRRKGDLRDDEAVRQIVEMIYTGEFQRVSRWRRISPYWRWVVAEVPQEELTRRLLEGERTERGFMAALMRVHADLMRRPIMGEKTPAHLGFVSTILEWFPDARVVHVLRDPRAVYVSDRHRRRTKGRAPYSWLARVPLLLESVVLVQTVVNWRSALRMHAEYQAAYPERYVLVQFEDIVLRPYEALPPLFRFLGVEVPDYAKVSLPTAHGMRTSSEGLDPTATERWRTRIHPFARLFIEFFLGRSMRRFGYTV